MGKKKTIRITIAALAALSLFAYTATAIGSSAEETAAETELLSGSSNSLNLLEPTEAGEGKSALLESGDKAVGENEKLVLYFNEATTVIKVEDKSNGFIWSSGVSESTKEGLTSQWKNFSSSLAVVEYMSSGAPTTALQATSLDSGNQPPVIGYIENGVELTLDFAKPQLQLKMIITLTKDGISVEIPDESIISTSGDENSQFTLSKIFVLPFFGAREAEKDANGYIFIPDGCGALMNFGTSGKYSMAFSGRIYGGDLGIVKENVTLTEIPRVNSKQINFPIFGIVNGIGNNASLAIIENGAEYAEIIANPAGVRLDVFWACAKFVYNEAFFQSTGSGTGFSTLQKKQNVVNAKISFRILSGDDADYVGFAKTYRQYLLDKNELTDTVAECGGNAEDITLLMRAFMSEQCLSLFGYDTKMLTTINDVSQWSDDFLGENVKLIVALTGFSSGGNSGTKLRDWSVEGKIGSEKDLQRLYEKLSENNSRLVLEKNIIRGFDGQILRRDLVYRIDSMLAASTVQKELYSEINYNSSQAIGEICDRLTELPEYKRSLYLTEIGSHAISDFRSGSEKNRSEVIEEIRQSLAKAVSLNGFLMCDYPNQYALKYATAITNTPTSSSQYLYETATVPFNTVLLAGYKEMYSEPLNFGTQTIDDILKLIDYNIYPSYIFTELNSAEFDKTNTNDIYSSKYTDLSAYAVEAYAKINEVLSQVKGEGIENKSVPESGVSVTEYANGKQIAVNYNDHSVTYNGIEIAAKSVVVL